MSGDQHSIGRAAALRDAATGRIRATTSLVVALAAGLTAAFTALAAASTHPRQHVVRSPDAGPTQARRVSAPVPVLVPVAVGRTDNPPSTNRSPPAATTAPTPATAPAAAPATTLPVVASGGS